MAFLISYQQDFNEDSAVLFTSFHKGKHAFKKLKIACLRTHFKCKNHKKKTICCIFKQILSALVIWLVLSKIKKRNNRGKNTTFSIGKQIWEPIICL